MPLPIWISRLSDGKPSITEHGDLNEIYRRTYNDTTLYKPIKGNWYIELDHSI